MALSLVWTPFPGAASERLANLVATILLTLAGYMALPDRMRSANLYLLPLGVTAAAIVAIMLGLFGDSLMRGVADDDNALDRGLTLLALLLWPSVAWLRSRRRDREALGLAVVVAVALALSPNVGQIAALAIGALAFAVTSFRPRLGVGLTAGVAAGLLAVAPLLPFIARPVGAALFGPLSPGVLTLKSWQRIVTTEPVRLITGHGFETALRGRVFGLIPVNAPSTALFAIWYELGVVGALAAAFALYASIRRAGRDVPLLVPGRDGGLCRGLHHRLHRRRPDGGVVADDAGHRHPGLRRDRARPVPHPPPEGGPPEAAAAGRAAAALACMVIPGSAESRCPLAGRFHRASRPHSRSRI